MNLFKAIARFLFIACVWSIGYAFWFQKLMKALWAFDPFAARHWRYIYSIWQRGWVIRQPSEWLFVILLFAFIPLWFVGCALLSSVSWMSLLKTILFFPLRIFKRKKGKKAPTKKIKVARKKSYKKIRPPAIRPATGKIKAAEKEPAPAASAPPAPAAPAPVPPPAPTPAPVVQSPPPPPPSSPAAYASPAPSATISGGSVADILKNAGYKLLQNITVGTQKIDFVGISATQLLVCLVDAEGGDWLADEERFNDEEPLWFSESNHRVSPVRLALNAKDALAQKLSGRARDLKLEPMVVIAQGTIINAEDMLDVWNNLHISVCRFGNGAPNDIKTLSETAKHVSPADDALYAEVASLLR